MGDVLYIFFEHNIVYSVYEMELFIMLYILYSVQCTYTYQEYKGLSNSLYAYFIYVIYDDEYV